MQSGRGRGGSEYRESKERLPKAQSVSDRGCAPVAAAFTKREAEIRNLQAEQLSIAKPNTDRAPDKYVSGRWFLSLADSVPISTSVNGSTVGQDARVSVENPLVDEAALIEERRKRREAIKAKYKGQETPLLVQALAISSNSTSMSSKTENVGANQHFKGYPPLYPYLLSTNGQLVDSPTTSPPQTPKDTSGQDSLMAFETGKDDDLANSSTHIGGDLGEDEPSAADYDPTLDMQEDKLRHDKRHFGDEVSSGAYDETKNNQQDVLIPEVLVEQPNAPKPRDEFDMFADEDEDMFAQITPYTTKPDGIEDVAKALPVPQPKALDMSMLDDWDDEEGYYKVILGELLEGRYHVQSNLGRGMFSGVVRALDHATKKLVAIKLIRSNETM